MGFGGEATVLGVKIGARHRLPASFFVAVAYLCWAARKASVTITERGAVFPDVPVMAQKYKLPKRIQGGKAKKARR
jgi:fumarate hydratase class I